MANTDGRPAKRAKEWKGKKGSAPTPARHIPWPEIFKHHISVVEGHTRMLEMVQKHTVEGTGNHKTITDLVKRGFEMLRQAKDISRAFVPPKGLFEKVPLGSSSESMYPGYSPGDVEYGKAAREFGQAVGSLKARDEGWALPADGPEYKFGHDNGGKRKTLFQKKKTESAGSEVKQNDAPEETKGDPVGTEDAETPCFVIDTDPTPLALNGSVREGGKKEKKRKRKDVVEEEKDVAVEETAVVVETEDISAEVNARLKAKEEKAKAKTEKKRRRESAGDESEKVVKKSKKEKPKKRDADHGEETSGDGERKKRKKNKDAN